MPKFLDLIKQFISFVGIGVIGTICDYAFFLIMLYLEGNYLVATIIGIIIGASINFTLNKKYTFKDKEKYSVKQSMIYVSTVIVYLIMTTACMYLFVDIIHWNSIISRGLTIAICVPTNYLLNKKFVYKN